jgi:nucleoid-associated protein YgaU
MNRQVGPSILLSVLIVCFFAVVLFQHDPPHGPRARDQPGREPKVTHANRGPGRDPRGASAVGVGTSSISARQREVQARTVRVAAGQSTAVPISTQPVRSPDRSAPPAREGRFDSVHQPDSGFTVVESSESIEDVAVRVYGSADQVEGLWHANRDALPRRDAPLAAGVVLRTPRVR